MTNFSMVFLQAGAPGSGTINLVFFGAMILIFWLFIIRPQSKKQKEQTRFVDTLEKGSDVVTASGVLGKVTKIEDQVVTLEVGPKVYMQFTKNAISKEMTDALYGKKS
jgi:preprotein translocase subunit YajC